MRRLTQDQAASFFLKKDLELLGQFKNSNTPVQCRCLRCGSICYPYRSNLCARAGNRACKTCAGNAKKDPAFVLASLQRAGFEMLDIYRGSNCRIKVRCLNCGILTATTFARIRDGHKCAGCADYGFDLSKPSLIYLIENNSLGALKVGVMNAHTDRLRKHQSNGWNILGVWYFENGEGIFDRESAILSWIRSRGANACCTKDQLPQSGFTETASTKDIDPTSVLDCIQNLVGSDCFSVC